jgi:hypothetical protein
MKIPTGRKARENWLRGERDRIGAVRFKRDAEADGSSIVTLT